jgi:hypothetical protein
MGDPAEAPSVGKLVQSLREGSAGVCSQEARLLEWCAPVACIVVRRALCGLS